MVLRPWLLAQTGERRNLMSQFSTWLPSRRQLQQHLARLVDTLEALVQRLRESIARTVGEAVANAVHEVTQRLGRSRRRPRRGPAGTGANRGTIRMSLNGTTARLTTGTATGMTRRPKVRSWRPPHAGVRRCLWAIRLRLGGWPGRSAAIRSLLPLRSAWAPLWSATPQGQSSASVWPVSAALCCICSV